MIRDIIKFLFTNLLYTKKEKEATIEKEEVMKKEIITYEDYITASGKYPERLSSPEITEAIKNNVKELLEKVNRLLVELNINDVKISSGFRPASVNAKVKNAAKKSLHMVGQAVDIIDSKDQKLATLLKEDAEKNKENSLLTKYELWLEHPQHTIGINTNWCHLDTSKSRSKRPVRVFTV